MQENNSGCFFLTQRSIVLYS